MTPHLNFAEAAALQDLSTYISRGRRINEQGIRLQAVGTVAAAWLPVMTPATLTSRIPAVLGLRTMALAETSQADVTVELSAITERLARMNPAETQLPLPPSRINAPWAAVTPPRTGWVSRGTVADSKLRTAAEQGVAEVAEAVPQSAGAHVVEQVRETVWSRPLEHGLPAGAAFGALSLGFLDDAADATSTVHTHGKWLRLTSAGGFILARNT
ncbi:hypothetical protein [Nesterenkonia sphaerica]|uniref:Uncharacterized protein n=1 Tax=Nesterenkonia sphaerica TaxID=1804988 RepID=A0A5R8ZXM0_9MICC|nr:hypothetical protein [Nesterenkonia sphaerica]TLP71152.1 hypothetical protein FEF27_12715 [Nesterenkonia sphaerica]